MKKAFVLGVILVLLVGMLIGCDISKSRTPTKTVEKFLKAINRGDFKKAQQYLVEGQTMSDYDPLVNYVGEIKEVAILNERVKEGPVTGTKIAYLTAIINPPPGLPLRGEVSSGEKIAGEEIVVGMGKASEEELGGPIAIIKQRETLGGLSYPSIETIENQFFFVLYWEEGKWRIFIY